MSTLTVTSFTLSNRLRATTSASDYQSMHKYVNVMFNVQDNAIFTHVTMQRCRCNVWHLSNSNVIIVKCVTKPQHVSNLKKRHLRPDHHITRPVTFYIRSCSVVVIVALLHTLFFGFCRGAVRCFLHIETVNNTACPFDFY